METIVIQKHISNDTIVYKVLQRKKKKESFGFRLHTFVVLYNGIDFLLKINPSTGGCMFYPFFSFFGWGRWKKNDENVLFLKMGILFSLFVPFLIGMKYFIGEIRAELIDGGLKLS